ncbi:FKBP-type peptidyl-prolyl cis-trans isomerase [Ferruginibacter sp. SUN106]|uniref:FKBP-type peptidyl-prolyl cis-trans isomerase n=1 Tax=Ferruginibacter sp. SUN106 TaxID=2978348 RepID=UPI003D367D17
MTKAFFFLLFTGIAVNTLAQTNPDTTVYQRASDGSEYKIIPSGKTDKLVNGNYMELSVVAKYMDSVLFSTYEDAMPQYGLYDTATFPAPFKEIFLNINNGDSIILKVATDGIIAKGQAAPFMQKGTYIYQYYRIVNVYNTKDQVDSAQKIHIPLAEEIANKKAEEQLQKTLLESAPQIESDSKLIEAYLAKNKLSAIKGKWGTYVVIKKEGTGKNITAADIASVNYTGKTFNGGKVFDSNTDPKFQHVQPYDVNVGQLSGIILGWPDAIKEMKRGTKATIYIPSSLGYGKEGRGPDIKPDDILVFDMEIFAAGTEGEVAATKAAKAKDTKAIVKKPVKAPAKKTVPAVKPKSTIKKAGK